MSKRRRPWDALPKPLRWPLLAVTSLALWISVIDRDPAAPAVVVGIVLLVAGLLFGADAAARRRARRRREQMPAGSGVWRGYVDSLDPGGLELLGGGSALTMMLGDAVTVDVVVTPSLLRLQPSWGGRLARYRAVELRWDQVASADFDAAVWEVGGKPRLSPLTPVRLLIVGDRVGEFYRPVSDGEAREGDWSAQERAEFDAELFADARSTFGPSYRFGTMPFTVLMNGADGLEQLLRRYIRGRLPSHGLIYADDDA